MNFSTNQVMQMFVLGKNETVEKVEVKKGEKVTHVSYKVKNGSEVIDVTDLIDVKNVLSVKNASAADDTLVRKGILIKLNDEVNEGAPVAGNDYVLTLTYRGFGEEDTYSKVVMAKATKGDDAASLLVKLAKELLLNKDVEYSPLYALYTPAGVEITEETVGSAVTAEGFYIVEPKPYWSLGRFAETLMNVSVQTASIVVDGEEVSDWLETYKVAPAYKADGKTPLVAAIPNTHKVADLEYFCKGERGTSNALVGWPDTPDYKGKVNADSTNGYDVLTVHYAYVGANASNQKSEKDLIFVAESGTTEAGQLATIAETLEAYI